MCMPPLRCGTTKTGEVHRTDYRGIRLGTARSAPAADQLMCIRVAGGEVDLRRQVKAAGGKWRPHQQVWELQYAQVVALI
jgi:hypothetical protein